MDVKEWKRKKKFFKSIFGIAIVMILLVGCGASSKESENMVGLSTADYGESYSAATGDTSGMAVDGMQSEMAVSEKSTDDSGTEMAQTGQKWIVTQTMSLETVDLDDFISELNKKIAEYDGYTEQAQTYGNKEDTYRNASYTIRIPMDTFDQFGDEISELATVTYTSMSKTDITLSYVDTESYLKALRTEQDTLLSILEDADNVTDVLAVQTQLTQVRAKINSYESQLRSMDNQINYSTLYLDVTQVERVTEAGDGSFWDEVRQKIADNAYALVRVIRSISITVLTSLPFLLPIIAILVIMILVKKHKKKKQKKEIDK